MSTYYDLYETPDVQNTGEKQPLHARIVPSGTYSKKDFIERVSRHQPFPHNIIEGVLGAVVDELAEALADWIHRGTGRTWTFQHFVEVYP